MSHIKELKSAILIILVLLWACFIYWLFSSGIKLTSNISLLFLSLYFAAYILIWFLQRRYPNRLIKTIHIIVGIPLILPFGLLLSAINSISLLAHVFFFAVTCFILALLIPLILTQAFGIIIEEDIVLFIGLTLGSGIAIVLYRPILRFVYFLIPFKSNRSDVLKKNFKDDLTEYVLNKENIRLIIYLGYAVYLTAYSLQLLYGDGFFFSGEINRAVYQSFLCFLAIDRVLIYSQSLKFKPSILLSKLIEPFKMDDDKEKQ